MPMTVLSNKKKNKRTQYAVLGGVGVALVGIWICLPLMTNSSLDSTAQTTFKTKPANVRGLNGEIQLEGQAPGMALTGEMINNPALSAQNIPSGLYKADGSSDTIRFDEAQLPANGAASTGSGSPAAGGGAGGGGAAGGGSGGGGAASAVSGGKGKLASMAGLGGSSGGSSSASSPVSSKTQFGSGSAKNDFAPTANLPKGGKADGKLVSSLKNAASLGDKAAAAKALDASKGLASSAFDGNVKNADLNTALEQSVSNGEAGLGEAMDQTIKDLKANDKTLDNKKYNIPKPAETEADDEDEFAKEILKMVLQTAISSMLGPVFGAIGQAMATGINSNWKQSK